MLKRNSSDSISAFFTQIRNAILAQRKTVCVPQTNVNWDLASLLLRENFIEGVFKLSPKLEFFIVVLGDDSSSEKILNMNRLSRPSKRVYVKHNRIKNTLDGMGLVLLSTSQGVMTGQEASAKSLGGELLCEIW
uniref:Small ribosomal subunit protein uS8c n=1 Tax=Chloropicon maureeniae TaxID=1461542 RepID=A0A4D6C3D1_9CHLO|nr:ribosomal protein S8 [Chloropicon maureeniae]QBX98225.1 ribosomal protein S8 [Chloropicon maureeniae]